MTGRRSSNALAWPLRHNTQRWQSTASRRRTPGIAATLQTRQLQKARWIQTHPMGFHTGIHGFSDEHNLVN
eukprot:11165386-Lingulodinium_polyedra.AAC.1